MASRTYHQLTEDLLKHKLDSLPKNPGIYQFKSSKNEILYIGKAKNLRNRVRQYFQGKGNVSSRIRLMVSKVADVEIIVTDSELEALILEATLIKKYKPHYNVDLKDDKSYPYIVITREPYPRVFVTRRVADDGSKYFGPFTEVGSMRDSLALIKELFRVRSCNYFIDDDSIAKKKHKLCLDYQMKKCDGPCEGLISERRYNSMIDNVRLLLKGKTSALISEWSGKMEEASDALRFEEAQRLRDAINQLNVYNLRQKIIDHDLTDRDIVALVKEDRTACGILFNVREGKIVGKRHYIIGNVGDENEENILERFLSDHYLEQGDIPEEIYLSHKPADAGLIHQFLAGKKGGKVKLHVPQSGIRMRLMAMCIMNAKIILDEYRSRISKRSKPPLALALLQKSLALKNLPRRIDCFDISNLQGSDSVASMVVFIEGRPRKSEYKRFRIRSVQGSDDYSSMREVIRRRYTRVMAEGGRMPDLIMVDGGKGQLSSAVEALRSLEEGGGDMGGVNLVGLAKKLEDLYVPGSSDPQNIPKTSPALILLRRIRDEAHRFALTYHRKLRSDRMLATELRHVRGVGIKYSRKLLERFGSVQQIRSAPLSEISGVVGPKTAQKIREYFDENDF